MGDCAVENGHAHPKEEDAPEVPVEPAEPQAVAGGQRKPGGIRREPSFSRWCKDPSAASNAPAGAASPASAPSDDDSEEEFELPLLPPAAAAHRLPMDIEAGAAAGSDSLPVSPWLIAKIIFLIASWYTLSTCLTLYNKEMLGKRMWKFPAPFLMNTVHFTMQAVASRVIVWFQQRGMEAERNPMSWKDYFLRVVPTALATALDINLTNISFVFITVTFATMCKSGAPIFILLFAFLFRLEKPSFNILGIMLIVSVGVLLTVAKETQFNLWGFIFIMLAAVMSGFRWCMTQILLQKEEYGLKNPFTLMSYVTPVMAITTAIISIAMDPWHDVRASHFFDSPAHILRSILLMLLGGALAFFMVWISTPFLGSTTFMPQHLTYQSSHHAKNPFLFCWNQAIHCWFLLFHFFHAPRVRILVITNKSCLQSSIVGLLLRHACQVFLLVFAKGSIIFSIFYLVYNHLICSLKVLTEYVLVSVTSAVTVTIAGIVKEAVTILVAVLFFNDPFTWLKGFGLATIIFGVSLFNLYKYHKFRKDHHSKHVDPNFHSSNGASKYVIIDDDIEDQDDTG